MEFVARANLKFVTECGKLVDEWPDAGKFQTVQDARRAAQIALNKYAPLKVEIWENYGYENVRLVQTIPPQPTA